MCRTKSIWYNFISCAAVAVICLGTPSNSIAQKTDILTLRNGDVITGEIKSLNRNKLEFSTPRMSTVYIEWQEIARINSSKVFQVELITLDLIVVTLGVSEEDGVLQVTQDGVKRTYAMSEITEMTRLKGTFFSRLKATVQLGGNVVKANDERTYNFDGSLQYRSSKILSNATLSSYLSAQAGRDANQTNKARYSLNRLLKHGWGAGGNAQFESNDELNLESRINVGLSASKSIIQSNIILFYAFVGLQSNSEKFSTAPETLTSAEAVGSTTFEYFKFRNPDIDLSISASVYPSITEEDRVRANINGRISYEVISDLDLSLNGYFDWDSRPAPGSPKNDYGFFTSIGYSFN